MNDIDNKWESDEDDYTDEEYIQNEIPPADIDKGFRDNVLQVKHSLYDNIVLAPPLGSSKAQGREVLQEYLNRLNDVYVLSVNAQNGNNTINDEQLAVFPEKTRETIKQVLNWIKEYFSKNRVPDTIPYSDHIRKSFHDYQFVQTDSFDD